MTHHPAASATSSRQQADAQGRVKRPTRKAASSPIRTRARTQKTVTDYQFCHGSVQNTATFIQTRHEYKLKIIVFPYEKNKKLH